MTKYRQNTINGGNDSAAVGMQVILKSIIKCFGYLGHFCEKTFGDNGIHSYNINLDSRDIPMIRTFD